MKLPIKEIDQAKTARNPIKIIPQAPLKKPAWIKLNLPQGGRFQEIKSILRRNELHSVCEEASCPNIGECFSRGTATFMILGDICTRRCPFCDVAHGRPLPVDLDEPLRLAKTIQELRLSYVVITSVDRDDLRDGGAKHFANCIRKIRDFLPQTKIEILVPDFRGRLETALPILQATPPDVFNHNLETVPRLYKAVRPGADYQHSLSLLEKFHKSCPDIPIKSGLMLGLGETEEEIITALKELRTRNVSILTMGQYLQPSPYHLPIANFIHPDTFAMYERLALDLGFTSADCAPMVRSSYHADEQWVRSKT